MRLWRLTRRGQTALDGAGALKHGGRYSRPGAPVVSFASEPGLAVLVALRYLLGDPRDARDDFVLGWAEIDSVPERAPDVDDDAAIRDWVTEWLDERRGLLAAVRSRVLPGGGRRVDEPASSRCLRRSAARHTALQLRRMPPHSADAGPLRRRRPQHRVVSGGS
jgi:RES domain-containing protein